MKAGYKMILIVQAEQFAIMYLEICIWSTNLWERP